MDWHKLIIAAGDYISPYEGENDNAIPYSQEQDYGRFAAWATANHITHWSNPFLHNKDVPFIIKNGRECRKLKQTPNPLHDEIADGFDHSRMYKNDKKYFLVCHIYDNRGEQCRNLWTWCEKNGLTFRIIPYSWYSPDGAICIEITAKEDKPNETD